MKKPQTIIPLVGIVMLGFSVTAISIRQVHADFSGVWVLDKHRTPNVPRALTNFTMAVFQDEQQLLVETQVDGDVHYQQPKEGGYVPGTLTLSGINPRVTYSLDGQETTAARRGGDVWGGGAYVKFQVKAQWSKDGQSLNLSGADEISSIWRLDWRQTFKEHWTLAEGGTVLKIRRSMTDGGGSDSIQLILRREKDKPQSSEQ